MKFKKVHSLTQQFQLEEIGRETGYTTDEEVISFLITEYKTHYQEEGKHRKKSGNVTYF